MHDSLISKGKTLSLNDGIILLHSCGHFMSTFQIKPHHGTINGNTPEIINDNSYKNSVKKKPHEPSSKYNNFPVEILYFACKLNRRNAIPAKFSQ